MMGDLLVDNYSFESGLTGWTYTSGSEGIAVTEERQYSGRSSLFIVSGQGEERGMVSGVLEASGGRSYAAHVRTIVRNGSGILGLRFWDRSRQMIGSTDTSANTKVTEWSLMSVAACAPNGSAYVSVYLGTSKEDACEVYFDDVFITGEITSIGMPVTNSTVHAATLGKDAANRDILYAVIDGATDFDAKLVAVDLNKEQATAAIDLPGASGGWAAATASNGQIYVGSYKKGLLYQYTPGESKAVVAGQSSEGQTFIFCLTAGADGAVYGGTYPGAAIFKYERDGGFTEVGPSPVHSEENYVRSIDYDRERDFLFVGVGSHAHLKILDNTTGQITEILPEAYVGEEFVYDVDYTGGKLFARVLPSQKGLVFDIAREEGRITATLESEIDGVHSLGVSPCHEGKVYYCNNGILHYYDIATRKSVSLQANTTISPVDYFIARLEDQENYPGHTVVGIGSKNGKTRIFKYNIANRRLAVSDLDIPEAPTDIQTVIQGPDGKIYSSGYLVGGTGVYTPLRDELNVQYKGVMQCENMAVLGDKMYFGVYPGARIYGYDPSQLWTIEHGGDNPRKLFELKGMDQDRPFGMVGAEGKLFIGTVPGYGKLGGALTVYDPTDGSFDVHRNPVTDQSVITLTYYDGIVYGGTSVYGGLGIDPRADEAKLLLYEVKRKQSEVVSLPVPGLKAVTAVTVGPDQRIWGMAEGYLFIYNPRSRHFDSCEHIFPEVKYSATVWRDAFLLTGKDGQLYCAMRGKLYRWEPLTQKMIMLDSGVKCLTQDDFGHLYYSNGKTVLKRYALLQ